MGTKNMYKNIYRKIKVIIVLLTFCGNFIFPAEYCHAQIISADMGLLGLPAPGAMVSLSSKFVPTLLRGIRIYPDNPLKFDFMIDSGNTGLTGSDLEKETGKNVRYFLASLTMPEEDMWVNLSPYEEDRVISDSLAQTELGRDMLAQDYFLKQITASLIYPEDDLGKEFWDKVYKKAYEQYGTTNIPINTFNKVWIVPEKANVFQDGDRAYLVDVHLKVMLEEDYLALQLNLGNDQMDMNGHSENENKELNSISSDVVRDIVIPEIEKEVNGGKNFALLRQITHAWALATWFKRNLKQSFLSRVYVNQKKIVGVDIEDKEVKEKIYNQYLEAFKKGVCDYVKVEYDKYTKKNIPRKYFSGGVTYSSSSVIVSDLKDMQNQFNDFAMRQKEQFTQFRSRMNKRVEDARISIASIRMEVADNFSAMLSSRKSTIMSALAGMFLALSATPSLASNSDQEVARIFREGQNSPAMVSRESGEKDAKKTASFSESSLYYNFSDEQIEIISEMMPYVESMNESLGDYGLVVYVKSFDEQKSKGIRGGAVELTIQEKGKSWTLATLVVQKEYAPGNRKEKKLFLKLLNQDKKMAYSNRWVRRNVYSTLNQGVFLMDNKERKIKEFSSDFVKNYIVKGLFLVGLQDPALDNFIKSYQQYHWVNNGVALPETNDAPASDVKIIDNTVVVSTTNEDFFRSVQFKPDVHSVDLKIPQDTIHIAIGVDLTGSITREMALAQRRSLVKLVEQCKAQGLDNVRISIATVGESDIKIPESMTPDEILNFLNETTFLQMPGKGNTPFIEKLDSLIMTQPRGARIYFPTDAWQDYAKKGKKPLTKKQILNLRVDGKDIYQIIDEAERKGQDIYILNVSNENEAPPLIEILKEYNKAHVHISNSDYESFGVEIVRNAQQFFSVKVPRNVENDKLAISLLGESEEVMSSFRADGTAGDQGANADFLSQKAKAQGSLSIDGYGHFLMPFSDLQVAGITQGVMQIVPKVNQVSINNKEQEKNLFVLIVDASGSYSQQFEKNRENLEEHLRNLHKICDVPGLVVIANNKVKSIVTSDINRQIDFLNSITPRGGTPNFEAIEKARQIISNEMQKPENFKKKANIGLLGDGITTMFKETRVKEYKKSNGEIGVSVVQSGFDAMQKDFDDMRKTLEEMNDEGINFMLAGPYKNYLLRLFDPNNIESLSAEGVLGFDAKTQYESSGHSAGRFLVANVIASNDNPIEKKIFSNNDIYNAAFGLLLKGLSAEDQAIPFDQSFVPEKAYLTEVSKTGEFIKVIKEYDIQLPSYRDFQDGPLVAKNTGTEADRFNKTIVIDGETGIPAVFYETIDNQLLALNHKAMIDEINKILREKNRDYRDGRFPQFERITGFPVGGVYYWVDNKNYESTLGELIKALVSGDENVKIDGVLAQGYEEGIKGVRSSDSDPTGSSSGVGVKDVGGIRLDAQNFDIQTKGKMLDFSTPESLNQITSDQIPGFIPVIISIVPVTNLSSAQDFFDQDSQFYL